MRKTIKKILCSLLVVVMCLTSAPLSGFDGLDFKAEAAEYKLGDIIKFGSYPQTEVEDETLITELNALAPEWEDWTSYEYYSGDGTFGSMVQGDWMRYTDVIYGSEKYRGVKFTQYRPDRTYCASWDSNQSKNNYYIDCNYWFKFEAIDWRVLSPETGFVICETIIDSQPYSNTIYYVESLDNKKQAYFNDGFYNNYASNYETSSIRSWLNKEFYYTAFDSNEREKIEEVDIDNRGYYSLNETYGYEYLDSIPTKDKIYIPSYNDMINVLYGFINLGMYEDDDTRDTFGSDYAKCQGLYSKTYSGNSSWYLRSSGSSSYDCCRVDSGGSIGFEAVYRSSIGIRPALKLNHISGMVDPDNSTGDNQNGSLDYTAEEKGYIEQHLNFSNCFYNDVTRDLRFAENIWENMDTWVQNGAELAHDIIEGPLEILTFQFFDGLECGANPYEVILLDFLASDITQSYFAETAQEDAFAVAINIINDTVKMFDFDYKWAESFDLKEELKSLISVSDYSGNKLYQSLNTLFMGKAKNEVKTVFESFECFGKLFDFLDVGLSVADFFVEMLRYVVAVESFYNSSEYFKSVMNFISEEMYNVNTNYAKKFDDTLSFYEESLTYDSILNYVIENKGIGSGLILIGKMTSSLLSKATYSMIMKIFKVGSSAAGKMNAALWAAEVGFGLSNLITGNDTAVNCRRLLRANYMFDVATHNVMERFKTTLNKNKTFGGALLFDTSFNIFKNIQIYSMEQYKTYCECVSSKPLTINKSWFKSEAEDIAGKIVTWKTIQCHYDANTKANIDTAVVACPTDIYVYRKSDNKLMASVINNISKSYCNEVAIVCIGEEKALACTSIEDYQIKIVATGDGTMDVIYNCYSGSQNISELNFNDIPINSGDSYILECDEQYVRREDGVAYKTDGSVEGCSCNCHASGIKKFFFNFILFFQKLFKKNAVCACGVAHY